MIHITCTSCKKQLNIDDAFAGGACRCQYCGTIQTVAKPSRQKTAPTGKSAKTLFENKARGGVGSGSGLEDLADVVASSGLSDNRLAGPPLAAAAPPQNLLRLLAIAATIIIVLAAALFFVIFHSSSHPAANLAQTPATPQNPAPEEVKPSAANFCALPIDQPVVVYLIDNGSSADTVLDTVKSAMFKSLATLGPDRRFQIRFWNPQSEIFPSDGQGTLAVKDNIDLAQDRVQNVPAQGGTDPLVSLQKAMGAHPGLIILVTAKAGDFLDDSLVNKVMEIRGTSAVRIDVVAVNGGPADGVLAKIAQKTGGQFLSLSEAQLKSFAY